MRSRLPFLPSSGLPWETDPSPALISLDIFDTLLLRRVETPVLVFDEVGRRARAAGLIDSGLTAPLFRLTRQEAERRARLAARQERGTDEVELAAICRHLPVADPAALMALELAVEADVLFANPLLLDGLRALAAQGRHPVLLSDMYLPPETLRGLLRGAGIDDGLYRALYVSCAYGCSKRDGGLFRRLLADYPSLSPGAVLHVGDDPIGDVAMANAAGLRAVHYAPPPSLGRMRERERTLAGFANLPSPPLRRLAALAGRNDDPDDAFWLDFGALVLGPAVVEYCRWVVEDCQARGIRLIAPLMREADLFAPLMRAWIEHCGFGIRVEPLFVSRQALAPLEYAELNGALARGILSARSHLPWDALLRQAGGSTPSEWETLAGLTLDKLAGERLADGGSALEAILALFDAPDVRLVAAERAMETQACARDYLTSVLGETERVALVDLGARGSTPAALVALLQDGPRRADVYLCYGVAALAEPLGSGVTVRVFCGETDVGMSLGRVLYRSPQILERALTGLSGTTLGYQRDGAGRGVPHVGAAPAQGEEARALTLLQAGIWRYAEVTENAERHSGRRSPRLTGEEALFPLAAALLMPTEGEARRLGSLRYDYNDGTGLERGVCDAIAMAGVEALVNTPTAPLMSMALGLRPLTSPWPQGALTLRKSDIFQGPATVMVLDAGHGAVCRALVAEIQRQGHRRISVAAVGGDGGMGPEFIHVAREAGLEVVAYADLMPHLIPQAFYHGVPVLPLERLPEAGSPPLALVTLGYVDRLAALAKAHFTAVGQPVRLIALGRSDLQSGVFTNESERREG